MLDILKPLAIRRATDAALGDVNVLLQSLLVEVVAENYRYFLHERLNWDTDEEPETFCWPPLLATERQVSGLFASALSNVCPVSRPELPIVRTQSKDTVDNDGDSDGSGRIDYYATFGQRSVALELKRVPVSPTSNLMEATLLRTKWDSVVNQADGALRYMRKHKSDFPSAVSVGLLVIRPSRLLGRATTPAHGRQEATIRFAPQAREVTKTLNPDFLAVYRPPVEMQTIMGWGEEGNGIRVFPGVIFAAHVAVKAS